MKTLKFAVISVLSLVLIGCGEHDYTGTYLMGTNAECTTLDKFSIMSVTKNGEVLNVTLNPVFKDIPLQSSSAYINKDGKLIVEFVQAQVNKLFGSKPGIKMTMVLSSDTNNKVMIESWKQEISGNVGHFIVDLISDEKIKVGNVESPNIIYEMAQVTTKQGLCLIQG